MTQVSWVRQLGLAVALFLLGSFAYWVEYKHKPRKDTEQQQSKKIFQIAKAPLKAIVLNTGNQVYELNCLDLSAQLCKPGDNSKWELARPSKLKADDSNANNLVSTLNNLTATEIIDLKDETPEKRAALLKEYGLDPASRDATNARKIAIQTAEGEWVVYLGLNHPIGDGIFSVVEKAAAGQKPGGNIDDSRVFLVPSYFKTHLEHDLTYWRNKKLLTLASHEIGSFTLESKKAGVIQGHKKDGQWTLESKGQNLAGDIENIDSLLSGLAYLSAKDFASDSKTDARAASALKGLRNLVTLTLRKEKGDAKEGPAPVTLKLYGKSEDPAPAKSRQVPYSSEKLFAMVSNLDPLFELDLSAKGRLDKGINDLRLTKLITSMERFAAKKIVLAGKPYGTEPLKLINSEGKWVNEKTQAQVNSERVQALLEKLSGNRIKEFVPAASAKGNEKDGLELTLGDDKEPVKRRLLFWKTGDQLYARDLLSKGKGNEVFVVDTSVRDGLPWAPDYFNKTDARPTQEPAQADASKSK